MLEDSVKNRINEAREIFDKEFRELFEIIIALDDPSILQEKISYIALSVGRELVAPEGMHGMDGIFLAYTSYEKALEFATSKEFFKLAYPRSS